MCLGGWPAEFCKARAHRRYQYSSVDPFPHRLQLLWLGLNAIGAKRAIFVSEKGRKVNVGGISWAAMKASIAIIAILVASHAALADPAGSDWPFGKPAQPGGLPDRDGTPPPVPVRWLEGAVGYEQAVEIQKETHLPILVWSTWSETPACQQMFNYINTQKPRRALRPYIRVSINGHGIAPDAAFAKKQGLEPAYFYIVSPSSHKFTDQLWPWKPGVTWVMLPDLEDALVAKLTAAK